MLYRPTTEGRQKEKDTGDSGTRRLMNGRINKKGNYLLKFNMSFQSNCY